MSDWMPSAERHAAHAFIDELLSAQRERRPYDVERARERMKFVAFLDEDCIQARQLARVRY